jgi:hypothetical protein
MRVRSPIGELPFTVTAVRRDGTTVVVDGELGAWRSRIEIEPSDVPMLARAAARPLAAAGVALAVAAVLVRRL